MLSEKNLNFIKKSFINHFKSLHKRFNDQRRLSFPENNEKGMIPHTFFKEDALIQANWTEDIIEIRFNEELIKKEVIENPNCKFRSLRNYFEEVANHEYGHTRTLENIFLLFPKDTRYILTNKNLDDITQDDLTRCYVESNCYYLEFFNLRNIDLNFFEHIFLDFWANLKVRNIINEDPPKECLNERLNGFYDLSPQVINRKTFLKLLLYTQLFFIHDKWAILEEKFRESELDQLLLVYKSVNKFFNKILELNDDFDSMEEYLVELAKILETINYNAIIFSNQLTNQDKRKLRSFIGKLRENVP